MEGRFHTICHTCSEEHFSESWDEADDFYREHQSEGHDVETLNLVE